MNRFKAGIVFYSIGLAIVILSRLPGAALFFISPFYLLFFILNPVLYIFLTWQMARRKNWARIVLLVLYFLSTIFLLWSLFNILHDPNKTAVIYSAVTGILACLFKGVGLGLVFTSEVKNCKTSINPIKK
ncbi:MAG: hypothetical protein Q7V63_09460 [Gammaproteobacteria bacterium]|nr:hypothetical protein [Gammaproteobacteria bacterium]